ncbi:hypothetical protein KIW84_030703 [Lathyrus oleraceus]|uniref:DUF7745 domain-containing protein n=1 Tax=Pisum sativum TaxID=3888 RepID=A0A9D4XQE4_PEA|nr:hypothetical protein KIW84_030703 [Pisum sativum]
MDQLEQENRELKEEVARLGALMEQLVAAQNQPAQQPATPVQRTVISEVVASTVPAASAPYMPNAMPVGFPWGMPPGFMPDIPAPTFAHMPASSPVPFAAPPAVHTMPRVDDPIYHSEPSEGPDVNEKMDAMNDQFLELRKELKTLRGKDLFGKSAAELCLVPGVKIPVKFKVPDFEKYKGNTCPLAHLVMYARKMSTQTDNDQLLIHYFQDSLSDAALRWYMSLDSANIRSFNDLGEAFVKQYNFPLLQIIDYCGEFPNVPLLGTCGGISYNPILARRQLGFPLKDKPHNILLEGVFFQEGKDPQGLKARMVRAWRNIHKKGRNELGPKNCSALESYTSWVRQRAAEYLMPYDYPRPTSFDVAGPSTLPNQGVEELREEDLSRAWIREREELLHQLKEKDALIEFLEHQVIDDPNDTCTSLLPRSSKFWKRKYDRLVKEKTDMEAAYEREIKKMCASRLPASRASRDP